MFVKDFRNCLWLIFLLHIQAAENENKFPIGDPRNCVGTKALFRMEALPGGGFDNLENVDMGPVIFHNYSRCQTSNDGKYLLPDSLYVIPIKKSNMEVFGEIIDKWQEYKSMTCTTINADANFFGVVSGSFSAEYKHTKKTQVEDMSSTVRVQIRHNLYKLRRIPDSQLHPALKFRILDMGHKVMDNNLIQAEYLAELIVRDYGTHVITTVDVGAILAQEINLKKSFLSDDKTDSSKVKVSASANFFGKVGFDASVSHSSSQEFQKRYNDSVTSSRYITHGGPMLHDNFSIQEWTKGMDDSLVAIDRDGDPLDYIITPNALPELSETVVRKVGVILHSVIQKYYDVNTREGCTDQSSPNFAFPANLDDGSCKTAASNYTFGGVFQTCSPDPRIHKDLCSKYLQVNPLTGKYSCPNGYEAVLVKRGASCKCRRIFWLWYDCSGCKDGAYETYWCAAIGKVKDNSGYLFGGLYSTTSENPVTKTNGCPANFYPLKFGGHMVVCVSDDYELGYKFSVPFAGFFSCSAGNPLVLSSNLHSQAKQTENGHRVPLVMSVRNSDPSKWPHKCPTGYSQHLAGVDQGCEINYCVKANSFIFGNLPNIIRPPFYKVNEYAAEVNGIQDSLKRERENPHGDGKLSVGTTAGIAIGVALIVGLATISLFYGIRKRRSQQPYQRSRRNDDDVLPIISNESSYGAVETAEPQTGGNTNIKIVASNV